MLNHAVITYRMFNVYRCVEASVSHEVTFGSWLRQRRTALGITRDELSESLGISLDLLRKPESGKRQPSGQVAHLLAGYFHVGQEEKAHGESRLNMLVRRRTIRAH